MVSDIFFSEGRLEMSPVPIPGAVTELAWGDILTNRILVVVTAAVMVAGLRDIIRLVPALIYGINRPRGCLSIEYNVSLSHIRNFSAATAVLAFGLISDRFGLLRPDFLKGIPAPWSAPATIGLLFSFPVLRRLCSAAIRTHRLDNTGQAAVRNQIFNHFIVLSALALITAGAAGIFNIPDSTTRIVILAETALSYTFSIIRSAQILASSYSCLRTFLYLCGLEFLPAAVFTATVALF